MHEPIQRDKRCAGEVQGGTNRDAWGGPSTPSVLISTTATSDPGRRRPRCCLNGPRAQRPKTLGSGDIRQNPGGNLSGFRTLLSVSKAGPAGANCRYCGKNSNTWRINLNLKDLREKRDAFTNTMRNILSRAETEKRGLTADEKKDFDG